MKWLACEAGQSGKIGSNHRKTIAYSTATVTRSIPWTSFLVLLPFSPSRGFSKPWLRCAQTKNREACTARKGLDVSDLARKKEGPARRRRALPVSND